MKNIRIQWFVLFIMVLLLMGCGVQKNVDLKSDQGMKIANALPVREDTGSDRSNLDMLDEILVQCLCPAVHVCTDIGLTRLSQAKMAKYHQTIQ